MAKISKKKYSTFEMREQSRADIGHWLNEFNTLEHASHTELVLFGSTSIEGALERLIVLNLPNPGDTDTLFGGTAPMATFAQKIRIAEALNYLTPNMKKDLKGIRDLRNIFAHAHLPITLKSANVIEVVRSLSMCKDPAKEASDYIALTKQENKAVAVGEHVEYSINGSILGPDCLALLDDDDRVIFSMSPLPDSTDEGSKLFLTLKLLWLLLVLPSIGSTRKDA